MQRIIDVIARDAGHVAGGYPEDQLPGSDDYVGYYRNEYFEELVFIQRRDSNTGTLLHSDLGWKPQEVIRGRCYEVILSKAEKEWLAACWRGSVLFRPDKSDEVAMDLSIGERMSLRKAGIPVEQYARTGELDHLIAMAKSAFPDHYVSEELSGAEEDRTAICKHCQQKITPLPRGRWVHVVGGRRGCRADSFDRLGTWDDNLDRKWMATPAK